MCVCVCVLCVGYKRGTMKAAYFRGYAHGPAEAPTRYVL